MRHQGFGKLVLTLAATCGMMCQPARAETRSYVVSWFGQAMDSKDGDCPEGVNPRWHEQRLKDIADLGFSQKEIDDMVAAELTKKSRKIGDLINDRGRIDGQPVNAYLHPSAVVDPKLRGYNGKYAYGFNLDGKGAASPNSFTDPETGEAGVNHQLARAFGCMPEFRGTLTATAGNWAWTWSQMKDNQPAWVVTIEGADLSKDGDATITFDRALDHLRSNSDGAARYDMTYRIDPDPRWHNVYPARIEKGVLTLRDPGTREIHLLQDPQVIPEFRMSHVHLRLKTDPGGALEIMVGGYQPWADLYFSFASGGSGNEDAQTGDIPGLYYLMKRYADADPDPATGQNTTISATYYLQAVPAFVMPPAKSAVH